MRVFLLGVVRLVGVLAEVNSQRIYHYRGHTQANTRHKKRQNNTLVLT
jgi:hypothetical protein